MNTHAIGKKFEKRAFEFKERLRKQIKGGSL